MTAPAHRLPRRVATALAVCALGAGPLACGLRGQAQVFAAASIAPAVEAALAEAGVPATVNAAASSTLAQQIDAGADAALFVSAHGRWLDQLEEQGLLEPGSRRALAGNRLVWVTHRGWTLDWSPDMGPPEGHRIAMGDPAHVPAGQYARAALQEMGWWDRVQPEVVPAMDVRAALALVARAETSLGIVYATDARAEPRVWVVGPLPPSTRSAVVYELAVLRGRAEVAAPAAAALLGPAGRAVLERLGFDPAPGRQTTPLPQDRAAGGWLEAHEWQALRLSLQVGLLATILALPFAVALAYWLARTRSRLRTLVEAVVILPMVLPPVVVGYFLLVWFGRSGWIPTSLPFTWVGAALAALVMGFPLMLRALRQAFENVDPALEQAAATLGARPLRAFFTVTLPLALPGLVAGASLCFARSLGEFGATITFAGNLPGETRTLPLAIWTALQSPEREESAWRLTLLCVAVSLLATVLSEWLLRRRQQRREGGGP